MGNYSNNITAIGTKGRLIYVDEPEGGTETLTEFDSLLLAGRDNFLDMFGIDGIYQPGSLNRAIRAIVKNIKDDSQSGSIRHKSPLVAIKTPNDASIGITAVEFESGQLVSIPPRKGADARSFQLLRILKQSAVWVTYEIK